MENFAPVFIVGAPRSGTTLLAVLLNRHSQIAIPPETQFFSEYKSTVLEQSLKNSSREERVASVLSFPRIKDLDLRAEKVLLHFRKYENGDKGLFQALLETYAEREQKTRVGEKSPRHLEHVDKLLEYYPSAKILCIVRDGRDVVRSLAKTPWAEPDNPRRESIFCMDWSDFARIAAHHDRNIDKSHFMLVRYEDILTNAEQQIQAICSFLGEDYEPQMLTGETGSGVVPEWEVEWKQKAEKAIDSSRAFAWRSQASTRDIWWMNVMMGPELKMLGYADTTIESCPFWLRFRLFLSKTPYLPMIRPLSLLVLKIARACRVQGL